MRARSAGHSDDHPVDEFVLGRLLCLPGEEFRDRPELFGRLRHGRSIAEVYFPLNLGGRFSKNACLPSARSSLSSSAMTSARAMPARSVGPLGSIWPIQRLLAASTIGA